MRRATRLSFIVILLGLGVGVYLAYGDEIAFYVRLFRAYRTARRFYASYEHLARDVAFHPEMEPRLDVYSPPSGAGHPVLVFVHGGSWKDYHKELFAPVAMRLLPEEIVVVIPDYTLHPGAGYEQMASEVAAAVSWTLDNIEQYGGDPRRVVVAGHSAGAHLGLLAAMDPRFLGEFGHSSAEVCGLLGLSGVYDVGAEYDFWRAKGTTPEVMLSVMGGQGSFAQASPLSYVRGDLPPVLLIHGEEDKTVPAAISADLYAALEAVGAQSELKIYPGAGHSDFLFTALAEERAPVVADLAAFVQRCTAQDAADQ
jgi:acetyl esterase/lipase